MREKPWSKSSIVEADTLPNALRRLADLLEDDTPPNERAFVWVEQTDGLPLTEIT